MTSRRSLSRFVAASTAPLILVLLFAVFSLLRPETFPTATNVTTILSTQSVLIVVALGVLFPLAVGEFDLSIGSVLGFAAMVAALAVSAHELPVGVAAALAIGAGTLIGLTNGLLIQLLGINAFITTLATSTILGGLTLWISEGATITGVPEAFTDLGRHKVFGVQATIVYAVVVCAICWYVFEHTPVGRRLFALGGNAAAARLAGIRTGRLRVLAFTVSGAVAALAGVMTVATAGSASPSGGPSYLLPAYAGAFLGATTIKPGRFNVLGTVIAIVLLAVGIAGLQQLSAPYWIAPVFNGCALLIAVGVAASRQPRLA